MLVDQQGKACPVILFLGICLKLFEIISMELLIVDHSVSGGKIEKKSYTIYVFTSFMWLHLKPSEPFRVSVNEVWWIMLTEESSDDGSIVHPTTQPPALRPSHNQEMD